MFLFYYLVGNIPEHSFGVKAIQKLYVARTKDANLFIDKKYTSEKKMARYEKNQSIKKNLTEAQKQHVEFNREIKISFGQSLKLYMMDLCSCCVSEKMKESKL